MACAPFILTSAQADDESPRNSEGALLERADRSLLLVRPYEGYPLPAALS
ncbi:MAG: hypothetical protein GX100_07950 [candidate division WS1 bacterium]|nr:hypothetical protein [candidate division WS1 bacterium]